MKKKIIISVLAICLLTGCGSTPKLTNGEEALVKLKDGTMYSVDEIWKEFKNSYGLNILLNKIDNKILTEEFKDKKKDADEYISNYEAQIKNSYKNDAGELDEEALNNDLTQAGYNSLEAFLERQRVSYLTNQATLEYAKTQLKDAEIKSEYKDNIYGDVSAMHVLVKPTSSSEADLKTAKEKAEKIIAAIKKDIKSGTKVKDAFEKYKDNKDVTFEDLGAFNNGDMVDAFFKATIALKKGSYSTAPVKTSYGYHVIYKYDEKAKPSLEDSKEKIKETLASKKVSEDQTLQAKAMMELRKKYGVDFKDSDIKDTYNKYINYSINTK